jgi:hypothetical protein
LQSVSSEGLVLGLGVPNLYVTWRTERIPRLLKLA